VTVKQQQQQEQHETERARGSANAANSAPSHWPSWWLSACCWALWEWQTCAKLLLVVQPC